MTQQGGGTGWRGGGHPGGWHPPARGLGVGTGTRVAGGGRALGGIAEEAGFALLALGTLRVVLAVLGGDRGDVWHQGVVTSRHVPMSHSSPPHFLPGSAQKRGHRCWSGRGSRSRSRSPGRVPSSPARSGWHSAGTTAPRSPRGTWGHSGVTVAWWRRRHQAHHLATGCHLHSSTSPAGPRPVSLGPVTSMATSLRPTLAMRPS